MASGHRRRQIAGRLLYASGLPLLLTPGEKISKSLTKLERNFPGSRYPESRTRLLSGGARWPGCGRAKSPRGKGEFNACCASMHLACASPRLRANSTGSGERSTTIIVPTRVGVNRCEKTTRSGDTNCPHTRGGEPYYQFNNQLSRRIVPTRVGVNRRTWYNLG
jgi:hypothetical protein